MNKDRQGKFKKGKKKIVKRREYVIRVKERLRRKGAATKKDTRYTGRRRKPKF